MKKITSKFHLGALTIVIQLSGDFFRVALQLEKAGPTFWSFNPYSSLPQTCQLSRFYRESHDFLTFLMAFRQASQSHGFWVNTLAMKLLIRNRTTPCCKFRPSYPLIAVLKVIKEKKSGILLQEWPCLNKEFIHPRPNGKEFRLIWNGKNWISLLFAESPDFFLGSLGFPLSEVGKSVAIRCNRRHRK